MTYLYWSLTVFVMTLLLLLLRKLPFVAKRVYVFAWAVVVLRAILPFKIPSLTSVYNALNPYLPLNQDMLPLVNVRQPGNALPAFSSWRISRVGMLLGVLLFLCCLAVICAKTVTLIGRAEAYQDAAAESWKRSLKKGGKIKILRSEQIKSPMACNLGFFSYIIVPGGFRTDGNTVPVLLHEYMHIVWRDSFLKLLACFMVCLHWFNPLVWLVYYAVNRDIEIACDEDVLQALGRQSRAGYANELVRFTGTCGQALFTPFKSGRVIRERVRQIMLFREVTGERMLFTGALLLLMLLCFATNASAFWNRRVPAVPEGPAASMALPVGREWEPAPAEPVRRQFLSMTGGVAGAHDIPVGVMAVYDDGGRGFSFRRDEKVTLTLRTVERFSGLGQGFEAGYLFGGNEGKRTPLFSGQSANGVQILFEIPWEGDYRFYVECASSDTVLVESMTVERK